MPEKRLERTRKAYGDVAKATPTPAPRLPHPARNLGPHLKTPSSGEIVTEHHRSAKKRG